MLTISRNAHEHLVNLLLPVAADILRYDPCLKKKSCSTTNNTKSACKKVPKQNTGKRTRGKEQQRRCGIIYINICMQTPTNKQRTCFIRYFPANEKERRKKIKD